MKLTLLLNTTTLAASEKEIGGKPHLVIPVVVLKQGILNGLYYSANEIQATTAAWNGVPVPVDHPTNVNGDFISARSPEVESASTIGKFYNVNFDTASNSLKGEIWINIEDAEAKGHGAIIEHFRGGEMMELSTGLYSNTIPVAGDHDGTKYDKAVIGISPDHLALLPNSVGACSIADGCGALRANCAGNPDCSCGKTETNEKKPSLWEKIKASMGFKANELSHGDTRSQLSSLLRSSVGEDPWPYIEEVFDAYFVYELRGSFYRQDYTLTEGASLASFVGSPEQVIIKTEYQKITPNQSMKPEDQKAIIDSIIANEGNEFAESDRANLEATHDSILTNMATPTPAAKVAPLVPVAVEPTVNQDQASVLTPEERSALTRFMANEDAQVEVLRANVVAAYPHLTPEIVANMSAVEVTALAKGINPSADYSGLSGALPITNSKGERQEEYTPPPVLLATNEEWDGQSKTANA